MSARDAAKDWTGLYERLARASEATRETAAPSRERSDNVLAERAKALAAPHEDQGQRRRMLQLLTFTLGGERFGLETRNVLAVGGRAEITPVPSSPSFLVGVASFRGEIQAVFDVRRLFGGGAARETAEAARVIFLGGERIEFGIVADAVDEVVTIPADDVSPRPWGGGAATQGGVTPDAISVLDGDALLADQRLFIDQTGGTGAGPGGKDELR